MYLKTDFAVMLTEKRVKTMAEYIERQKVIDITAEMGALETQRRVQEIPAADVVEVVRCQNCAYSHKGCDSDMTKEIWCTYWQKTQGKAWNMMRFDDFCSHGAKMDLED